MCSIPQVSASSFPSWSRFRGCSSSWLASSSCEQEESVTCNVSKVPRSLVTLQERCKVCMILKYLPTFSQKIEQACLSIRDPIHLCEHIHRNTVTKQICKQTLAEDFGHVHMRSSISQNTLSDRKGSQDYSAKGRLLSDSARSLCAVWLFSLLKPQNHEVVTWLPQPCCLWL